MTGRSQARRSLALVLAAYGTASALSLAFAQTASQPRPLKHFLEDNGWVALPLPDRNLGPGSVVKVTQKNSTVSMQWQGDLRRCGITDNAFGYVRGKYPAIGVGQTFGIKASFAADYIRRLHGNADLGQASAGTLQIEGSGGDAVQLRALAMWLVEANGLRRMSQLCYRLVAEEDNYVVSEAFRVSRATYGLIDKNGARLGVTGAAFPSASPNSAGVLSVVEDVYFGVRGVKQLAPILRLPLTGPLPEADGLLRLMEP